MTGLQTIINDYNICCSHANRHKSKDNRGCARLCGSNHSAGAYFLLSDSEDNSIELADDDTGVTVKGAFKEGSVIESKTIEITDDHLNTMKTNGF